MKIMKKLTLFLVICIGLLIGCTKENGPATKTENPSKTAVANKLAIDSFFVTGASSYEFGNKFYASKNGKITKLGCRMPAVGSYRVSLWDFATTNLIAATTINLTDTAQFKYNDISAVDIVANTRYVISINNTSSGVAKQYFIFYKKPGTASIYPFTTGSITYETLQEKLSAISIFPDIVLLNDQKYFGGVPDIQFEYTE